MNDKEKLFYENKGLVWYVFKRNYKRTKRYRDDIIQSGYLGLWKACLTYKDDLKIKFSTYAYRCINNEMMKYVTNQLRYEGRYDTFTMLENKADLDVNDLVVDESSFDDVYINNILDCTQNKEIFELLLQGFTYDEIAEKVGCSRQMLYERLKNDKFKIKRRINNEKRIS